MDMRVEIEDEVLFVYKYHSNKSSKRLSVIFHLFMASCLQFVVHVLTFRVL